MSPMVTDTPRSPTLVTSRDPVGPTALDNEQAPGEQAVMDAVFIVAGCWLFLFILVYSLRKHNV